MGSGEGRARDRREWQGLVAVGQLVVTVDRLGGQKASACVCGEWLIGRREQRAGENLQSGCPTARQSRLDSTRLELRLSTNGSVEPSPMAHKHAVTAVLHEPLRCRRSLLAGRTKGTEGRRDRSGGRRAQLPAATHDQRRSPPITAPVCTAPTRVSHSRPAAD